MARFNIPKKEGFLCVGVITQPHSLRGEVIFKPLLDNIELIEKGLKLSTVDDAEFKVQSVRNSNKGLIVKFENVKDRNEAEKARKTYLYIAYSQLPKEAEDEVYYYDLVNYEVIDKTNTILGTVKKVFDTGANTIIEVKLSVPVKEDDKVKKTILIPYTEDMILEINKNDKELIIDKELFDMYLEI